MIVTTLETAEKVPFNLNGLKMFTNDKVGVVHLTLQPGDEIALHANPFDVLFYILEGNATITCEDQRVVVETNSTVYIEKDKQRGMKNSGVGPLIVLVYKIF